MNLRTQLLTCAAAAALFALSPSAKAQAKVGGGASSQTLSAIGYVDDGVGAKTKTKRKTDKTRAAATQRQQKEGAKLQVLEELEELLVDLETGRAALARIGQDEQAEEMARLIEKVKAKFQAAARSGQAPARDGRQLGSDARGLPGGGLDMSDLGLRMRAVAVAREFHVESGWETAARQLGALLECGELIQAGADPGKVMEAYSGAPDLDERIAMLDRAAAGLKTRGQRDRAMLCASLSEWYAGKRDTIVAPGTKEAPMRPQSSAAPEAPRQPRALSLEKRVDRIEILGFARDAHLAGGSREAAGKLGSLMNLGRLQESGASSEELARATPQDVSMEQLVEYVRQAVPVLEQAGKGPKAKACRALADYYTKRDAPAGGGSVDRAPSERGPSTGTFRFTTPPPAPRAPQGANGVEARIDALQRQIEELRRTVAEMRGGQRRR